MQKRCISLIAALIVSAFGWVACDDIEIVSPPGPRGFSAYETWVEAVKSGKIEWTEPTDLPNYFKYIKGEKGESGASAYATWRDWVRDGSVDDPHRPGQKWSAERIAKPDFYYFLTGAKGEDGNTPFINEKGNWQIGDKDTGIPARGRDGQKGDKGDTGAKGEKGDTGAKGEKGDTGAKGEKGDTGAKGEKGDTGAKGEKGDTGAKGEKGDTGAKGDKGDTGAKGEKGDTGAKGEKGDTGAKGEKGDTGAKGEKGDTGAKGEKGDTGAKGEKGDAGAKGDKGDTGAKGEKGDAGSKGDAGAKGDKGEAGTKDTVEIRGGFWYINGVNTNVKAEGRDGAPGVGKSAFQLWVDEVKAGTILDKEGQRWLETKIQLSDFWDYLKGKDGKDGGAGGGNAAPAPLQKTPLKIVSFLPAIQDPSGPGEVHNILAEINLETSPGAKVYYQLSGGAAFEPPVDQLTVHQDVAKNDGLCKLYIIVYSSVQVVHIWAEESGKLPSYQHHLFLGQLFPQLTSLNAN